MLYGCGFVLERLSAMFGGKITPLEVRHRTKSASSIIIDQIGYEGCMAMEGYEVQDLLCRLSGLFTELQQSFRKMEAVNAAGICGVLATRLGGFCGRGGGGDRRGFKQNNPTPAHKAPRPGR